MKKTKNKTQKPHQSDAVTVETLYHKETDWEWLARMKREGKPLGNYRLPSGFGMGGKV